MPKAVDGIIDAIDRLVDESLSKPIVDDYSYDRYDKCWHCDRSWHGIPVTEKIAEMYGRGVFDDDYRAADDDSTILCPGSDFIGPVAQQPRWRSPSLTEQLIGGWFSVGWTVITHQRRWWRTQLPSNAHIELRHQPNRITLEIGDDALTFDAENVRFQYEHDETDIRPDGIRRVIHGPRTVMDVLADNAPGIGGTWTPLTAPGVTTPSRRAAIPAERVSVVYTSYVENVTYTDNRDGRGYTLADIEDLRAAPWVVYHDDDDWQWEPTDPRPRTRDEVLEARQAQVAAQQQRLEQFGTRPGAR